MASLNIPSRLAPSSTTSQAVPHFVTAIIARFWLLAAGRSVSCKIAIGNLAEFAPVLLPPVHVHEVFCSQSVVVIDNILL